MLGANVVVEGARAGVPGFVAVGSELLGVVGLLLALMVMGASSAIVLSTVGLGNGS